MGSTGQGLASALQVAHDRILEFHQGERAQSHEVTQGAITVLSVPQPVERAGLYIPGGLTSYPSTVLMTALPARAAGVNEIVICTPRTPEARPIKRFWPLRTFVALMSSTK